MNSVFLDNFNEHRQLFAALDDLNPLAEQAGQLLSSVLRDGGKIMF